MNIITSHNFRECATEKNIQFSRNEKKKFLKHKNIIKGIKIIHSCFICLIKINLTSFRIRSSNFVVDFLISFSTYTTFFEKPFFSPSDTHMCTYQGVKNHSFWKFCVRTKHDPFKEMLKTILWIKLFQISGFYNYKTMIFLCVTPVDQGQKKLSPISFMLLFS